MTRLDRHVMSVQNRLALGRFLVGLGWALLVVAALVWAGVLVDRTLGVRPPGWELWVYGGLGAAVVAAIVYAVVTRPDAKRAAVAIDDRLGLKEKFSTALYVRGQTDPFARAAVRDAEASAAGVNLTGKFPLAFPRVGYGVAALAALAYLTSLLSPMDLLARETPVEQVRLVEQRKAEDAKKAVKTAIAKAEQLPKAVADDEKVAIAKRELAEVLTRPPTEPTRARLKAMEAAQQMQEAIREAVKKNERFAQAESDRKAFKSLSAPTDQQGPVADAHRALANADFTEAVDELTKAVQNFDKMSDEQKQQAAQQMQDLARQLQQMAQDPKVQQKLEQQLQQMGANQQQAKQLAQQMQQAANGDQQAQQQLQQQMQQQMNNGQGPTQQQQQQMQQMMQQMQAMANTQAGAQAMAQAAQQMGQQMQQQAQQGQQPNPNQQPGQQGQQGQQQMAQAQQQMQQQLQQMQAAAQDLQQVQAAQQAAQQGAEAAAGQGGGQAGNGDQGENNGQQVAQGEMEWQAGDPQGNPGNGPGGAGIGQGDRSAKQVAPFGVKPEMSPSQEDEKGKILASRYVKAGSIKGEMRQELTDVAQAAEREAADEVEAERVSGQARKVLKDYFNAVQTGE